MTTSRRPSRRSSGDRRYLGADGPIPVRRFRPDEWLPPQVAFVEACRAAGFAECADLNLTWHFIGQLQTNKCASVVRYASVVHSVDRHRLIGASARPRGGQGG